MDVKDLRMFEDSLRSAANIVSSQMPGVASSFHSLASTVSIIANTNQEERQRKFLAGELPTQKLAMIMGVDREEAVVSVDELESNKELVDLCWSLRTYNDCLEWKVEIKDSVVTRFWTNELTLLSAGVLGQVVSYNIEDLVIRDQVSNVVYGANEVTRKIKERLLEAGIPLIQRPKLHTTDEIIKSIRSIVELCVLEETEYSFQYPLCYYGKGDLETYVQVSIRPNNKTSLYITRNFKGNGCLNATQLNELQHTLPGVKDDISLIVNVATSTETRTGMCVISDESVIAAFDERFGLTEDRMSFGSNMVGKVFVGFSVKDGRLDYIVVAERLVGKNEYRVMCVDGREITTEELMVEADKESSLLFDSLIKDKKNKEVW